MHVRISPPLPSGGTAHPPPPSSPSPELPSPSKTWTHLEVPPKCTVRALLIPNGEDLHRRQKPQPSHFTEEKPEAKRLRTMPKPYCCLSNL